MSVTLNGGVTFGGGLTLTAGPPTASTAGWFAGGTNGAGNQSRVSRITYATDTDTGTTRGPLSTVPYNYGASTGTFDYGWFGGSYTSSSPYSVSTVQRITYVTDTNTASIRGPLNRIVGELAATTDGTTYGWFGGGYGSTPGPNSINSLVSRITYATDTATATARGPLSVAVRSHGASGDTTYGWFGGGYKSGGPISTVSRITYASDTDTASARGSLSAVCYGMATTGNSTAGYFGGGAGLPIGTPGIRSTVDRIIYATDTATASTRGPLNITCKWLAASTDNNTYGWWGAGTPGPTQISSVSRITFATDTAVASTRGPLSTSVVQLSATSGIQ